MGAVAAGDGNGWVECRCGSRHWGRHGAAGLLLLRAGETGVELLMQLRAAWTHEGGSWGLLGGARDSHEDVVAAALREAAEEAGLDTAGVRVVGSVVGVDHEDWNYTYVVAITREATPVRALTGESDELRWVELAAVGALPLHRALGAAWPTLRPVIDDAVAANP